MSNPAAYNFNTFDSGSQAWMLTSAALVFFMTPGLALFYAGLVRTKSALNMLAQNMAAIGVLTIQWYFWGYSLAFNGGNYVFGDLNKMFFLSTNLEAAHPNAPFIPEMTYAVYQMMFAIISPALITGATADRFKYSSYLIFLFVWGSIVYDPIAHQILHPNGWLYQQGMMDFAGGVVVHVIAATAGLVAAIMLGPRTSYKNKEPMPAHSNMLVVVGTGILWFGWFGFNAGSGASTMPQPTSAFVATQVAAAFAGVTWNIIEVKTGGKATATGLCVGYVCGLATITPASGFVQPLPAMAIGIIASIVGFAGTRMRARFGYDDALDVFAVHGLGSASGVLLTGIFASTSVPGVSSGGWVDHQYKQLGIQLMGLVVGAAWSAVMTYIILSVLNATIGIRVSQEDEDKGLDQIIHGEPIYDIEARPQVTQNIEMTNEKKAKMVVSGAESIY